MKQIYLELRRWASTKTAPDALLFVVGLTYWTWVLWPYYSIPSQDDALNHMAYAGFLRDHSTWTLGSLPVPYSEEFGGGNLVFYPAGMHLGLATVSALLGLSDLGLLLKGLALLTLAALPVVVRRGMTHVAPRMGPWVSGWLAASVSTLLIFPAAPLGEGGMPRILAQVLAFPVAFRCWSGNISRNQWLLCVGVWVPILFYIHPSSFFVLFPLLLLNWPSATNKWTPFLALMLGALGCLAPLWSGEIHGSQIGLAPSAIATLTPASLWDRWKGVFHFLYSDPHGLLKFMSFRTWLAWWGLVALGLAGGRKRNLLVVLLPYALAFCVFMPWAWAQAPGAVFYQIVKRIVEVGYLPLVCCMALGLGALQLRVRGRARGLIVTGLILWTVVSGLKAQSTVRGMAQEFETPLRSEVTELRGLLKSVPQGAVVVSHQQWFGVIRSIRPDLKFVGAEGECRFSQVPACLGRMQWIREVQRAFQAQGRIQTNHFVGSPLFYAEAFQHPGVGQKSLHVIEVQRDPAL